MQRGEFIAPDRLGGFTTEGRGNRSATTAMCGELIAVIRGRRKALSRGQGVRRSSPATRHVLLFHVKPSVLRTGTEAVFGPMAAFVGCRFEV